MITDGDLDRIISTWLAEGPEQAPRDYVDRALGQVRAVKQRRRRVRPLLGDVLQRGYLISPLGVAIVLALLSALALAAGIGTGLIRVPSPPPAPPLTDDARLRPIHIDDWSAEMSIPETWRLDGDPTQLSEWRRFTGSDPQGELVVSHESPYQVTVCDPDCQDVRLPTPIPYSAAAQLEALKTGVGRVAGSQAWTDLPSDVLPEVKGRARLDTEARDADGRVWHHVYIVGLREQNALAIVWRQPTEVYKPALLAAVLARSQVPPAPVYTDGDLIVSRESGADFTMLIPGFWIGAEQPRVDGTPLNGVLRFGPDRVTVSIGEADGTFGWCEAACEELHSVTSLDALEAALRGRRELGPATDTRLGDEPARSLSAVRQPARRYVIAMHAGRPVGVMIDPGDWDVAEGIVEEMLDGFAFIDPPPPPPPEQVLSAADGRVELALPSAWYMIEGDLDAFHLFKQRMTVAAGSADGAITTCTDPAGPWERCREVKVGSLDALAEAVQPALVSDHGVGPPIARSERGTLDGEPSVVLRIQAYEHPARGGQEVVYIAAFHDGRPYLVRIHTSANHVRDLGAVIAGFRFLD
jgi:hypothetical protein